MLKTGLVSVTFRQLTPAEIITLVSKAGLEGIEWGGDIHVPHGNTGVAREVYQRTLDAGLQVASYGSYYRVGCREENPLPFEAILETAAELHAPTVRVWAGNKGSAASDEAWFHHVLAETDRIGMQAEKAGIGISFEYHANTLTDTVESAERLLTEVNRKNVSTYWQPPVPLNFEERLSSLKRMLPWLTNLHVFSWTEHEKHPLVSQEGDWLKYFEQVRPLPGIHYCMLEFVKDNSPEQFLEDAGTLKKMIG